MPFVLDGQGRWYYGEGRKHAEGLLGALSESLRRIEEPHRRLHEPAVLIQSERRNGRQGDAVATYNSETLKQLGAVQALFKQMAGLSLENILSDEAMLAGAVRTRGGVLLALVVVSFVVSVALGVLIIRSIVRPVSRALQFSMSLAASDHPLNAEPGKHDMRGTLASKKSPRSRLGPGEQAR